MCVSCPFFILSAVDLVLRTTRCMPNAGPNPDHGYTTFDNIGWSLVMALQILTMDFWENLYDKVPLLAYRKKKIRRVSTALRGRTRRAFLRAQLYGLGYPRQLYPRDKFIERFYMKNVVAVGRVKVNPDRLFKTLIE